MIITGKSLKLIHNLNSEFIIIYYIILKVIEISKIEIEKENSFF